MGLKYHNGPHPIPMGERFWNRVNKTEGCWLWTGGTDGKGYGVIGSNKSKPTKAYRFSFELANGPIPNGMVIMHKCDTPLCVRPDHLQLGTQTDNHRDMTRKLRNRRGVESHCAKLQESEVRSIRAMYASGNFEQKELAHLFHITQSSVSNIVRRKSWKHLA